jgi:hypothetical protein
MSSFICKLFQALDFKNAGRTKASGRIYSLVFFYVYVPVLSMQVTRMVVNYKIKFKNGLVEI